MSVDILPTSLPLDASTHFSKVLLPYLETLVRRYCSGVPRGRSVDREEEGEHAEALDKATIAVDGRLVGRHKWLQEGVDKFYAGMRALPKKEEEGRVKEAVAETTVEKEGQPGALLRKKRLLMLGSGMVAGPAVEEIAKRGDVQLLIGGLVSHFSSSSHVLMVSCS
jgi:alpha-aminoadipic semialdehyde synthase